MTRPPVAPIRRRRLLVSLVVVGVTVAVATGCGSRTATAGPPAPSPRPAGQPPTSPADTSVSSATAPSPAHGPVRVVGLGDSVTAGTACDCTTFVQLYATALAHRWHVPVTQTNLGEGGLTAAALLTQLEHDHARQVQVSASDVALVTIGANDLMPALRAWDDAPGLSSQTCGGECTPDDLDAVGDDIGQIVTHIRLLRRGRPTLVLVTTYWNVFEDGAVASADRGEAFGRWSDALTRRLNLSIVDAAHDNDATVVNLYVPFEGNGKDPTPLLASDGDHPNAAGHRVIAAAALSVTPATLDDLTTN